MNFAFDLSALIISIIVIVVLTAVIRFNTFLSILLACLLLALATLPLKEVMPTIMLGFGNTMQSIGLIIILGIMLGTMLDRTGATISIARSLLKFTRNRNAGLAVHLSGFITGVPIFCDSGFIVLHGINRSLVSTTGKPMAFMATALASGLYSIHCLIPPHPGSTAAAGIMGANIGRLILTGIPVAFVAAFAGFIWTSIMNGKKNVQPDSRPVHLGEFEGNAGLPPAFRSFLPIVIPLLLLTCRSVTLLVAKTAGSALSEILAFAGEPVVALTVGIGLALTLYKKIDARSLNELFDLSVEKAGPILAITAAGGIFGAVIKATGLGGITGNYLASKEMGLFIPFLIAAFLKTAQGSSTVAIMTAASIVSPMLPAMNLDNQAAYPGYPFYGSRFNDRIPHKRLLFLGYHKIFRPGSRNNPEDVYAGLTGHGIDSIFIRAAYRMFHAVIIIVRTSSYPAAFPFCPEVRAIVPHGIPPLSTFF
jgi:GntP family gluconate:H+ symporter